MPITWRGPDYFAGVPFHAESGFRVAEIWEREACGAADRTGDAPDGPSGRFLNAILPPSCGLAG